MMKTVRAFSCLLALIAAAPAAYAAFDYAAGAVRPLGMGGAFTAVEGDANALFFNPAGIALLTAPQASFASSRLFTGLETVDIGQNYFSAVYPLNPRIGNLGLAWSSLSSPGLYREDAITASFARSLDDLVRLPWGGANAGASVTYLMHAFSLDERTTGDPTFASASSKGAVSADLGVTTFLPAYKLTVGFAAKNIGRPNLGLAESDAVTSENVLGLSYFNTRLPGVALPDFTAAADVVFRDGKARPRAGLESIFFEGRFPVRAGYTGSDVTLGLGYALALGTGYALQMDYAFAWPLEIESTGGTHRLGVTVTFPGRPR